MNPKYLRRTILASLVAIAGCAIYPPESVIIIQPGSSVCTSTDAKECERLAKVAESLHSPAMNAAIAEARK